MLSNDAALLLFGRDSEAALEMGLSQVRGGEGTRGVAFWVLVDTSEAEFPL